MSSAADATPSEPQDATDPPEMVDGDAESLASAEVAAEPSPEATFVGYGRRRLWLMRNEQWLIYCLPFLVFMVFNMLEPAGPENGIFAKHEAMIDYQLYPYIYSAKIACTCLAMLWVWPGYRKFPWSASWLSVAVGLFGGVLWIASCKLQQTIDPQWLKDIGLGSLTKLGARAGFNPLDQMRETPGLAWTFLAIRFFGLVVVISIVEEFFLRAFLMRFVIEVDWWEVPFATKTPLAIATGIGVPMLMHPQELLPAFLWFSMITWLMFRTKSIWDCIIAHGLTNLVMGLWVLYSGDWFLM